MEQRVCLKNINPCISCGLCKGYLVEATTIVECLHTFCKTCIVKYLSKKNDCPTCKQFIHYSYPLDYIASDRTMQSIMDKLLPHIRKSEEERECEFYISKGLQHPRKEKTDYENERLKESARCFNRKPGVNANLSKKDNDKPTCSAKVETTSDIQEDLISLCLRSSSSALMDLDKRYILCNSNASVIKLKKFLSKKLFSDTSRFDELELYCNNRKIGKHHNLKYVSLAMWKITEQPIVLHYRTTAE